MRDLTVLAEQIRAVRDAEKRFMSLWRVEQVLVGPEVLDRLERDLAEVAQLADDVLSLSRQASGDADDRGDGPAADEDYCPRRDWPMNPNEAGPGGSDRWA